MFIIYLFIYSFLQTLLVAHTAYRKMIEWIMNNKLAKAWKVVIVP
jgi:hypothetical protein